MALLHRACCLPACAALWEPPSSPPPEPRHPGPRKAAWHYSQMPPPLLQRRKARLAAAVDAALRAPPRLSVQLDGGLTNVAGLTVLAEAVLDLPRAARNR